MFIGAISPKKRRCLDREFKSLKRKRMSQKQKVAVALNVCKIPKK